MEHEDADAAIGLGLLATAAGAKVFRTVLGYNKQRTGVKVCTS
jgi:hypothetical protein